MPYYRWKGVALDAALCKGTLFAHSPQALEAMLSKQEIALISYKHTWYIYVMPISYLHKLLFFEHLEALLSSGIHMWKALMVISEQTSDARFADVIYQIGLSVQQGHALHQALADAHLFTPEMISITHIGAKSGKLPIALKALCHYLYETHQFKKSVQNALFLPVCTMLLFVLMVSVIIGVIMPRYADLFVSMDKAVPRTTAILLNLRSYITSYTLIGYAIIIGAISMILIRMRRLVPVKIMLDTWKLHVPYVGPLMTYIALVHFLRSLGLLLQGGMPLVPALHIAHQAIHNLYIHKQFDDIIAAVQAGQSLSDAMQSSRSGLFAQDLILLITVGQETATLDRMVGRAADIYQKRVEHILARYTLMLQPLLMILLGCLIAALIFAVYMPLFNLADLM